MIASEFGAKMFLMFFSSSTWMLRTWMLSMSYLPADDNLFQIQEEPRTVKSVFANQQNLENHIFEIPQAKMVNLINVNKANWNRGGWLWWNQSKAARDLLCILAANFKNPIGCLQTKTIYLCKPWSYHSFVILWLWEVKKIIKEEEEDQHEFIYILSSWCVS